MKKKDDINVADLKSKCYKIINSNDAEEKVSNYIRELKEEMNVWILDNFDTASKCEKLDILGCNEIEHYIFRSRILRIQLDESFTDFFDIGRLIPNISVKDKDYEEKPFEHKSFDIPFFPFFFGCLFR